MTLSPLHLFVNWPVFTIYYFYHRSKTHYNQRFQWLLNSLMSIKDFKFGEFDILDILDAFTDISTAHKRLLMNYQSKLL